MAVIDELIAILGYKIQGQENLKKFGRGLDDAEKKARSSAKVITRGAYPPAQWQCLP